MAARLLVTGFGPFPRVPRNSSADLAQEIAASPRWRILGVAAQALVLPTTYAALDTVFAPILEVGAFDALLMIGVAGRTRAIRVERRAVNRASVLFPDAAGGKPARLTLAASPAARRTRVAPAPILAALLRRGLRGAISQDAGRYLCNAAYFRALAGPAPVLFLHIPKPPRKRRAHPRLQPKNSRWQDRASAGFADVALLLLREARNRRSDHDA